MMGPVKTITETGYENSIRTIWHKLPIAAIVDGPGRQSYTALHMDDPDIASRAVLLGHLMITIPVIAVIPLMLFLGLYMFGPTLWLYYVCAGLAGAWQWYSTAVPRWKESLRKKGVQENEIEETGRRTGLLWPGASSVGLFALHTTIAAICALRIGPWLVGRWFAWILPLSGSTSPTGFTAYSDYYLQHLELVSILPALAAGYVVCRYFQRLSTSAWILPTIILLYKLLTFADPHASVLFADPLSRFSYYFVIVRVSPTFSDLRGSDPIRVWEQMSVVAPFYSGLAYSIGALVKSHNILERIIKGVFAEPEPEVFGTEEVGAESAAEANKQPVQERNQV